MKKFKVEANETLHYLSKIIKANSFEQAKLMYQKMLDKGMVEIVSNKFFEFKITEIL